MQLTKQERKLVFDKFGGHCAYCGCELGRGWHADHIEPIVRVRKSVWSEYNEVTGFRKKRFLITGSVHPERETLENRNPACASCNVNKRDQSIEHFRAMISKFVASLNEYSVQYKIAKRYALVKETGIEVKFYFESLEK